MEVGEMRDTQRLKTTHRYKNILTVSNDIMPITIYKLFSFFEFCLLSFIYLRVLQKEDASTRFDIQLRRKQSKFSTRFIEADRSVVIRA